MPPVAALRRRLHALCLGVLVTAVASAHADPVARVTVRVRDTDRHALEGVSVRNSTTHGVTDAQGEVRWDLPTGPQRFILVRIGYAADTLRASILRDTVITATLREVEVDVAPVIVSSTRSERRLQDEPERVEVLAGDEPAEKSLQHPADLRNVVAELPGVRVQAASSATAASGLRLQGLRAQYSTVLLDGLPLAGTGGVGLGLLQLTPVDLQQVEVVKGAATALYGPSAMGGVLNLISRRPGERPERMLFVNATARGGADAGLWALRRFDARFGGSLLASVHTQPLVDADHDGWADVPGHRRGVVRPRLFWNGDRGRSAMLTLGLMAESREGGGNGDLRSRVATHHADVGGIVRWPWSARDVLVGRGAWSTDLATRRQYDPVAGPFDGHDTRTAGLAELTWLHTNGPLVWLAGASLEHDRVTVREFPALGHERTLAATLGRVTWTMTRWLTSSAAARLDDPQGTGSRWSPRVALLLHDGDTWAARVSSGAGYRVPGAFSEETEGLPWSRLRANDSLHIERLHQTALDLTWHRRGIELNATLFRSRLDDPARLVEHATLAALETAPTPTRTWGHEIYLFLERGPLTLSVDDAWTHATEHAAGGGTQPVALTPRHTFGLDVALGDADDGSRVAFEWFFTGRQRLEHDPAHTHSPAYSQVGVLASQRIGACTVYVNGENLTDVRASSFAPVRLPTPSPIGRLTTDAWGPLEGRAFNAGIQWRF